MNRRGFLAAIAGGAVAVTLPRLPLEFVPELVRRQELSLSEMISQTLKKHAPQIAANIQASNALLRRLKEEGVMKPWTGGMEAA